MSFRVVVVPEDPTFNGAILRPLLRRILEECGKPSARVEVLCDPFVRGYEHAKSVIGDLEPRNVRADLVVFCPDRDGRDKSAELSALESRSQTTGLRLLCCAAVEEVEAWLLAGHVELLGSGWSHVRSDPDVKQSVFQPFLATYGNPRDRDGGRSQLMRATLSNYAGLKQRCPEIDQLESRVRDLIAAQ